MTPADVSALSDCQPPNTDHSPVTLTLVVVLVEGLGNMTVAVVTKDAFTNELYYQKMLCIL